MSRTFAYVRVSTFEQETQNQVMEIEAAGFSVEPQELCLNLGDAHHQAARFSVSLVTSTPSLNLIPSITFGN